MNKKNECGVCGGAGHKDSAHTMREATPSGEKKITNLSPEN